MTSNVVNLAERRKPAPVTLKDHIIRASDDILEDWARFAGSNRLNEYFLSCTGLYSDHTKNYLEDLTAVSLLEQRLDLSPKIISPDFLPENLLGWVAAFRLENLVVSTPPMPTEGYARCFNILLQLKIKRLLSTQNQLP